jgi:hypothetical protein
MHKFVVVWSNWSIGEREEEVRKSRDLFLELEVH